MHIKPSQRKFKIYKNKLKFIYLILSFLVFVLISLIFSISKAANTLLGIIAIVFPTLILVRKAFSAQGARNSKKVLGNFFIGEAIKIIFSIILLTIFFVLCYNNLLGFVL